MPAACRVNETKSTLETYTLGLCTDRTKLFADFPPEDKIEGGLLARRPHVWGCYWDPQRYLLVLVPAFSPHLAHRQQFLVQLFL